MEGGPLCSISPGKTEDGRDPQVLRGNDDKGNRSGHGDNGILSGVFAGPSKKEPNKIA